MSYRRVDIYPLFRNWEFIGFRCVWTWYGTPQRIKSLDVDIGVSQFDDYVTSLPGNTEVKCHFATAD